jgi:NAD+ synthase (glutamine-hydrolysing)
MPSPHSSAETQADARAIVTSLGAELMEIPIESAMRAYDELLERTTDGSGAGAELAAENIQARIRGNLVMALSNRHGWLVLTTGNKSEMSVGYATLYGDMAGGFAPIKDCSKLLVYRLARYRNSLGPVIPERVIERPPSAELREGQKDSDSLPPYEVLDPILEAFIEEDLSVDEIEARGFDRVTVARVLDLVKRNEYKRRQAPPGVRVSRRAFGRDWRYPITSGYRR